MPEGFVRLVGGNGDGGGDNAATAENKEGDRLGTTHMKIRGD